VLGSGLTIAGAIACLSFTRMPYLQTMGLPAATGLIVTVAAAATLGPAVLAVASRAGLFEAKRRVKTRGWRRIGTAVVRWPGPILVATSMVTLVGLLALPGYKTSYDDRRYMPGDIPANIGYQAAARHFSQSRLNPDALLIETDHDMRNPTDMLVLDKVAKNIFHVPGVARVQAITRPSGTPIEHSSIPSQISIQNAVIIQNMQYLKDRLADMLKMGDELTQLIDTMRSTQDVMEDFSYSTDHLVDDMHQIRATTERIRDGIGDFDDAFRPIRNYFYWEPRCVNIPVCSAIRSAYDALDGVDELAESAQDTTSDVNNLKSTVPKIVAQWSPIIATLTNVQTAVLTMHSTFSGLIAQIDAFTDGATAMGKAFDGANNDDSFYLPPDVFQNPEFEAGLKVFLSPDGKATRLIIVHQNDPSSPEAVANVDAVKKVAFESIKGTPQEGANIQIGGTAAIYKDLQQGSRYDLLIAAVAALSLVFIIMLIVTRSLVVASVIVATVALSLGSSFGLAVLLWQRILGIELHYLVLAMAVIVLLAVGSDYNLLLVSRFKEELGAGLNTGTIRAMGGTGKVVTTAGLVFAFTMGSMIVSDLLVIGQVGTTICIGLLFDTLIVRSFLMPSIAMLLGRWFWWPQNVHPRPARNLSAGKVLAYRA
jgi:RND superfamily putative drug exporter